MWNPTRWNRWPSPTASSSPWLDRERTIEEVARFSRADAAAYRRLLTTTTRSRPCSTGGSSPRSALAPRWMTCWPVTRGARSGRAGPTVGGRGGPARVLQLHTSRRSCSGWLTRCSSRWTRPVPACCPPADLRLQQRSWSIPVAGRRAHRRHDRASGGPRQHHPLRRRVARLLIGDGRCTGVEPTSEQYRDGDGGGVHDPHQAPARHGACQRLAEEFHYGGHLRRPAPIAASTAAPEFASARPWTRCPPGWLIGRKT